MISQSAALTAPLAQGSQVGLVIMIGRIGSAHGERNVIAEVWSFCAGAPKTWRAGDDAEQKKKNKKRKIKTKFWEKCFLIKDYVKTDIVA